MEIKESIINRLRETKRENIEKVIDYMEETVSSKWGVMVITATMVVWLTMLGRPISWP